ncbi:maleylpyruvate isomerase N-terminal domain-containing protein [Actinoplanes sp. NPDC049118]|uniref:maleylpyruvate isomerase N-terminal domain-containing protein n=1 Tax=Actinoplanes sp. NPDC049118 TaxID=3155769 RepID=UPI0033F253A8
MDYRRTYRAAAVSFADLVSRLPDDRWGSPGLGDWTLRELVGHTVSSALRQVPDVLAATGDTVTVDSPQGYWAFARSAPPELVAAAVAASSDDARECGAWLGDEAAGRVSELTGLATTALAAVRDDDVITTPAGAMRVRDWLPTRTFELVVHGTDIAEAAGVPFEVVPEAVAEAVTQAAQIAAAVGDATPVLRALTGRTPLPKNFSVI